MSNRPTGTETYHAIVSTGLVSKKRLEVYSVLADGGPLTATEIAERMPGEKSPSKGNNVHARLCELRDMDLVEEVGERACSVSGRNVIVWDVTGRLPRKRVAPARRRWFLALRPGTAEAVPQIFISKDDAHRSGIGEIIEVVERARASTRNNYKNH